MISTKIIKDLITHHFSQFFGWSDISSFNFREINEIRSTSSSIIVFNFTCIEVLQSRVPLNLIFSTKTLISSAVNFCESYYFRTISGCLFKTWHHRFAMSTPRSKEQNEPLVITFQNFTSKLTFIQLF